MDAIRENHRRFLRGALTTGDNLGLRLDKLNLEIDDAGTHDHKENMLRAMSTFNMGDSLLDSYGYAFRQWCKVMKEQKDCEFFDIRSTTKALLGTGNTSVHEFGVTLNKPWGAPVISGTTLKGLVSAYLAKNGGEEWWKSNKDSTKSDYQVELFGGDRKSDGQSFSGSVIFNDAWIYPEKNKKWFMSDIINVHHQGYYGEKRLPDGTENPVPVKIAALTSNLKFFVTLQGNEKERKFIKSVLEKALSEDGMGGKTSVGYGRFEVLKSTEEQNAERIEKISSADNETLLQLNNEAGNVAALAEAFRNAVNSKPLSRDLRPLYLKHNPLKIILLEIKDGKVESIKVLNAFYRPVRNHFRKFLKANPDIKISKTPDAQEIFDFAVNSFDLTTEQIENNSLLKQIAYSWEDVVINDGNIDEILDNRSARKWPPVAGLKDAVEAADLDKDIKELALMELDGG